MTANEENIIALAAYREAGGVRPERRPDGVPTRRDSQWHSFAERTITVAMEVVEKMGASPALTDAIELIAKARDRVADHVEGKR